ncbi:hypothetical protein [Streptomyces sp. NPDC005009]
MVTLLRLLDLLSAAPDRLADAVTAPPGRLLGTAPAPLSAIGMLPPGLPYPVEALDHRFVSVDAGGVFVRGRGPAGAHSDHLRPESAHLLLSLADHAR